MKRREFIKYLAFGAISTCLPPAPKRFYTAKQNYFGSMTIKFNAAASNTGAGYFPIAGYEMITKEELLKLFPQKKGGPA